MPTDLSQASGFMWHDVPNRGGAITIVAAGAKSRRHRALECVAGRQCRLGRTGDVTAIPTNHVQAVNGNHWVAVPMAKNPDGSLVTGTVLGRIVNRSGAAIAATQRDGQPDSLPAGHAGHYAATLITHTNETYTTASSRSGPTIASTDWTFAHCDASNPFPGTAAGSRCDSSAGIPARSRAFCPCTSASGTASIRTLLYQVVYPSTGAYAARRWRGRVSRREFVLPLFGGQDDFGNTESDCRQGIRWAVIRGVSQSGNFTRAYIFLGMNQDESNRIVHEGAWPIIAGRRVSRELALGPAGRRARTLPTGQRRAAMVGAMARHGAQSARRQHSRPLQCKRHVSQDHRALRRLRSLCPEDDDRVGRHIGATPTFRWHPMCVGTTSQAPRTAAAAAGSTRTFPIRPPIVRAITGVPRAGLPRQSGVGDRTDQRAARGHAQLVDERNSAAAKPLPDSDRRRPG